MHYAINFSLLLYVLCIIILSNFQFVQVVWNTEWSNDILSSQRLSPRLFLAYLWCVLSVVLVNEQTCLSSLFAIETSYYYKACKWQTWQYNPFNHYYTSAINCTGIQVQTLFTNFNKSQKIWQTQTHGAQTVYLVQNHWFNGVHMSALIVLF